MASSSQIRAWWDMYECAPGRYTKVTFPGSGRSWALSVASESAPVWEAVAYIMSTEPYLFRESAGGTYNCRPPSLHSYALALDLNPSVNPMRNPPVYDYPQSFITRMEGIRANNKQAIYWGGRWPASNPPDTMHWQINVAPWDCYNITFDRGDGAMGQWKKPGDPVEDIEDADRVFEHQGTFAPGQNQASYNPSGLDEANDRTWIVMARFADWMMRH